ncbi:MAG TPA: hypothetical protein VLG76_02625 [Rhabdochlamydiaceae bacterium]|nr:hypothetical protein [Rhabdochlamydiaceae bacterium]
MRRQKHKAIDTVRLTIDFPAEQHAYLKTLAAQKGISMKQYVLESLSANVELKKGQKKIGKNKFKVLLDEIIKEDNDVLRRLADK